MFRLDIDFKPRLKNVIITSMKGVSGTGPGIGAHQRMSGERKAVLFRGKGLEFEKYRQFTPDDDAQMIDWKATLRAHKMLVKMYSEEQNKDIITFFDVSSSMSYSSIGKLKNEYAAELIASLVLNIVEAGDNAGLIMFNEKIVKVMPPLSGIGQYHNIMSMLSNPKLYDGKFNLVRSLYQLMGVLKRQAIILLVSDFIGLSGEWKRALEIMSTKFELIGIMVRDPADNKLPLAKAQIVTSDPFSDEELLVDPLRVAEEYERINQERIREIQILFRKMRSDLLILQTDQDFAGPVRKFFMGV